VQTESAAGPVETAPKAKPESRVRAPACAPAREAPPKVKRSKLTRIERIRHIVGLMVSGRWVTGSTGETLAAEWGIPAGTVGDDAVQASKTVREAIGNTDDLRARIVAIYENTISRASANGEHRNVIEALKGYSAVIGADAPKKLTIDGTLDSILALGFDSPESPTPAEPVAGSGSVRHRGSRSPAVEPPGRDPSGAG
jgi:hypothetical protein